MQIKFRQKVRWCTTPLRWLTSGVANKTSWDWLDLLIVPIFLAFGAFYLESRTEIRQENIAQEHIKQEVLNSYFQQMERLLLDKNLRSSMNDEDSEVRSVARAITTTTIQELGPKRNALLVKFLLESELIEYLNLSSIDLRGCMKRVLKGKKAHTV